MSDRIRPCPCCGTPIRVVSSGDGTSHYEVLPPPVDDASERTPSLATSEAFSAIYDAILDPGHYTEQIHHFPAPLRQMEPIARWQTRAVMTALGRLKPDGER